MVADLVRATAAALHSASTADAITDAVAGPLQRRIGLRVSARSVELDLGAPERSPELDSLTLVDLARFYGERLRNVGDLAIDWLLAAANLPAEDRTVGAVAAALGRTSAQFGSTVDSLVGKSLIRPEPGRGRFSFAVPGLDRHLQER